MCKAYLTYSIEYSKKAVYKYLIFVLYSIDYKSNRVYKLSHYVCVYFFLLWWGRKTVFVFCFVEPYNGARQKMRMAETTSDVQTEAESNGRKRKYVFNNSWC